MPFWSARADLVPANAAGESDHIARLRTDPDVLAAFQSLRERPTIRIADPSAVPRQLRPVVRGNVVVRWEYRRGSTLYVVWSEAREEFDANGHFRPFHDLAHAITAPGRGALQVKMSYWLGR